MARTARSNASCPPSAGVGPQMLEEKEADREDPAKRMKPTKQKAPMPRRGEGDGRGFGVMARSKGLQRRRAWSGARVIGEDTGGSRFGERNDAQKQVTCRDCRSAPPRHRDADPSLVKGARSRAAEGAHRTRPLVGLARDLGGCGAHAASETAPTPSLSRSREAQAAFRPLRQRFVAEAGSERDRLEPALSAFVATFPKDGHGPAGQGLPGPHRRSPRRSAAGARASGSARPSGPSGTTKDLARAGRRGDPLASATCRAKRSSISLPLVGKLIDPYARILLDECIVMAALGARRWYEAVAYMDLRLRDAQDEDSGGRANQIRRALDAVPHEALELMLQTMQRNPSATGYGPEIRKLVIARLAAVAIEQQDTELARRLVNRRAAAPAWEMRPRGSKSWPRVAGPRWWTAAR